MGERSLRGSRLGSVSYETERNTAPIDRQYAEYRCPSGHVFTVPFADDAELPDTWECKFDGGAAKLVGGEEPTPKKVKPPRTHWDMLLERRSVEDLEEVLSERLEVLRGRRTRASLPSVFRTQQVQNGPGGSSPGPFCVRDEFRVFERSTPA
jgi:hypothetical protein